jgi:hypothetical protein
MLIRARPSPCPALIRSRTDPAGLTDVARIVNDIRPGLYQQLRAHAGSGSAFQRGRLPRGHGARSAAQVARIRNYKTAR